MTFSVGGLRQSIWWFSAQARKRIDCLTHGVVSRESRVASSVRRRFPHRQRASPVWASRQRTSIYRRFAYASIGSLLKWGLVMRTFPGGHVGPNRYPHCKVSDSGHLCFWDTKLAMWVPMFRLTNAQLFEWMKSIKVLDMELR